MPRYLTDQDIADFRAELCRVATERFARFGYEGVTMRQLADALGCSPKTPYRYFKDKADILATVRAQAFASFADALEKAVVGVTDPLERGRRSTEAYIAFALKNPHAYRIMFDIDAPIDEKHAELASQAERAARYITSGAEGLAKAGVIAVDATMFGWAFWASLHGIVMLHQSGMLAHGPGYATLMPFLASLMIKGAAKGTTGELPKETKGKKK